MTGLRLDVYTGVMQRRYPDHGNPSALIASAVTALKRRQADSDAE